MEITRFNDAVPYDAPKHFGMSARRMQGNGASSAAKCAVSFSIFEPGGGCDASATPFEKIYVILSGEIDVTVGSETATLKQHDSCLILPDESRTMLNRSDHPCELLVIMPLEAA